MPRPRTRPLLPARRFPCPRDCGHLTRRAGYPCCRHCVWHQLQAPGFPHHTDLCEHQTAEALVRVVAPRAARCRAVPGHPAHAGVQYRTERLAPVVPATPRCPRSSWALCLDSRFSYIWPERGAAFCLWRSRCLHVTLFPARAPTGANSRSPMPCCSCSCRTPTGCASWSCRRPSAPRRH